MLNVKFSKFASAAKIASENDYLAIEKGKVICRKLPSQGWLFKDKISSADKDANRLAWSAFEKAFSKQSDPEIVKRFSLRYQVDFHAMKQSGAYLMPLHIEMAGVAAEDLRVSDLKRYTQKSLKHLTPHQIHKLWRKINPDPFLGQDVGPLRHLAGTPKNLWDWFFYNRYSMDWERVHLTKKLNISRHQHAYLQRVLYCIVNREMEEGMTLPYPDPDGKWDLYEVHRVVVKEGLTAYFLKPVSACSKLEKMVVFSSTKFFPSAENFDKTFLNDMEYDIGMTGYEAAKKLLKEGMKDRSFRKRREKVLVGGFSLGGVFAQLLASDLEAKHYKRISRLINFESPLVSEKRAIEFAKKINSLPRRETKQYITIYRVQGSIIPCGGAIHPYCRVKHPDFKVKLIEIKPSRLIKSERSLHTWRFLDSRNKNYKKIVFTKKELAKELNNIRRGEEIFWYEEIRRFWGARVIYPIAYLFFTISQKVFEILGISFIRRTHPTSIS
ncbi:MAG: lipase family protein [Anaerolineae bacterium]